MAPFKRDSILVMFRYNIDVHDYDVRLRSAKKFLKDGDKVDICHVIIFRLLLCIVIFGSFAMSSIPQLVAAFKNVTRIGMLSAGESSLSVQRTRNGFQGFSI